MLRCPMLFNWFDHPLIEGWREARLRAELQREQAAAPEDGGFQRLEVFRVEFLPRLARELVEPNAVHDRDHQAPALDNDGRSLTLGRHDLRPGIVRLEAMRAVGHG